jgi:hypothetical protein
MATPKWIILEWRSGGALLYLRRERRGNEA